MALILSLSVAHAVDLYVSPSGSDSGAGTEGDPFLTLTKARDALRLIDHSSEAATIWLAGGSYLQSSTLYLIASDSGASEEYPVTWKAKAGETPRIIGGKLITNWTATANPNIYVADLTANGVVSVVALYRYGYSIDFGVGINELFCNGSPATVARYPNTGWLSIGAVSGVTNFTCADPRPFTWTNSTDLMASGYWAHDYRQTTEFAHLTNPVVTVDMPSGDTPVEGKRYRFLNVLDELDQAGEYFIDRTGLLLYFWPPAAIATCEIFLSTANTAFDCTSVSNVRWDGLTIEDFKLNGIVTSYGGNVVITNCTVKNLWRYGVTVGLTTNLTITTCTVQDTGGRGISFGAGVRTTLVSGGGMITNCYLQRPGRVSPTYNAAVYLTGVSNFVVGNTFTNCPHQAIQFTGNEHRILTNYFIAITTETSDAGVIYSTQDWTYRGNVIGNNTFHHITKNDAGWEWDVTGVYFDNSVSGNIVTNNTFYNVHCGVFNHGGHDNYYAGNIFRNCGYHAFHCQRDSTERTNALWTALQAMPYTEEPWASRYPELLTYDLDTCLVMSGCVVSNNLYGNSTWLYAISGSDADMTFANNRSIDSTFSGAVLRGVSIH